MNHDKIELTEYGLKGNVQVDPTQVGDPNDFVLNRSPEGPEATEFAALKAWSQACSVNGTKTIVQICHPGRQIAFGKGTVAPSAVPMNFGTGFVSRLLNHLVFGTPRAMSTREIQTTIRHFVDASRKISMAGFAGVELHGAHGYLLAQFLSPQANVRTDAYGGHPRGRARIVVEIIRAIRAVVPADFCIGLKLNSVDVGSPAALTECMEQLQIITDENIDFLEISGGSFEDPTFSTGPTGEVEMLQGKKASTVAREAFFLEFAEMTRARFPHVPLMVTGGFRSRRGMEAALVAGSCDLVGLARPAVMNPHLPRDLILNTSICEPEAIQNVTRIKPTRLANALGVKLIGVGPERVSSVPGVKWST